MTDAEIEFALIPVDELREHEETDPDDVRKLATHIRRRGRVDSPIWVARGSFVILNGHHRYRALRSLGVRLVPAWLIDYDSEEVRLERWSRGPAITKGEVVARGTEGRRFPIKTTRHLLAVELPDRPTPLAELMTEAAPADRQPTVPRLSPRAVRSPDRG